MIGSKADTPDGIEAMLQKSGILVAAKQFDGADALIASALAKDSHNVEALRQKAEIRIAQGKLEELIEVLRQALNEFPEISSFINCLEQFTNVLAQLSWPTRNFPMASAS